MKNTLCNPVNCSLIKHIKDTKRATQKQTIFQYLQTHMATASMVSDATGIPQKNITRYKRDMELSGILFETEKKRCEKTGFMAWFLTTNPELFSSINKQLTLF